LPIICRRDLWTSPYNVIYDVANNEKKSYTITINIVMRLMTPVDSFTM